VRKGYIESGVLSGVSEELKYVISQMWERRDINPILGKATGVLGHSEFFEPIRNFHNRAPANSVNWTMTSINQSQTINPDCPARARTFLLKSSLGVRRAQENRSLVAPPAAGAPSISRRQVRV